MNGCAWRASISLRPHLAMSALDELMSSPPRSRAFAATNLSSSSPYLPSLEEIFAKKRAKISPKNSPKKPPFKAGNPAPRIPVDDRTTLTSAAGILREAPEIDIDTENITVSPSRGGKPANTRKPKASTPENFRTYDASNQAAILIESSSPTDKPWQKYKKPPSAQDDEPALPINRKPAATKKRSVNVSDTVSRHFGKTKEDPFVEDATRLDRVSGARDKVDGVLANIEQETAIPRRGDWTPPAAKQPIVLDSDSDARELFSSVDRIPVSKDVFQKLYDEFGRQEVDPAPGLPLQGASEVFRKRKLIEFVSTGQKQEKEQSVETPLLEDLQRPPQPERAKAKVPAPRKKTRTITELATAPFAAPISPELNLAGPDTEESMLKYFDSDGAVKALVEHQTMMMTQRTSKGKATKQPSKTTRRKKAGTQDHPILLSPSSALKQSSNQDFVFGTSSQLIEEQSPTTLKDLQIAIRASNRRDADPFHDDLGRRLWQAGARDENGKLMGLSSVDSRVGFESTGNDLTITPDAQSFVDIDDLLDSPVPVGLTACISGESLPTNPRFARPHKSNHESNIASGAGESASATPVEPRPKYELFTDAQLCGQLTSYGFKPIKKRSAMIALLDQCWKSQNPGASAGVIQTSSISTYSATRALQETSGGSTNQAAPKPKSRARTRTTEAEKNSVTQSTTSDKAIPKQPRVRRKKTEEKPDPMIGSSIPGPSAPKPRGRPKKSATAPVEADAQVPTPKRPRGRPKKSAVAAIEPEVPDLSPKRSRGRPRKSSTASIESEPLVSSPKRTRTRRSSTASIEPEVPDLSPKKPRGRPRKSSTVSVEYETVVLTPKRTRTRRSSTASIESEVPDLGPKKPRGRPRKSSTVSVEYEAVVLTPKRTRTRRSSTASIEPEVPDLSPKKPRGRPRKSSTVSVEYEAVVLTPKRTRTRRSSTASIESEAPSPRRRRSRGRKSSTASIDSWDAAPNPKKSRRRTRSTTSIESDDPGPRSKRARGGPRKSRVASTEILDSANATPSPGSSASLVFSSPPPLDLTMTEDGDMSLAVPLSDHQAELFRYITKAVTSAPNSKDPAKPSWYEKMLLYDPIVIEELTSWLNAGKLTHAGYDGEVSPYDVKQWCESKSVICLWRHTTKGKERKRY